MSLSFDPSAALDVFGSEAYEQTLGDVARARDEAFADVSLMHDSGSIPEAKRPLDAGFIDWPQHLLDGIAADGEDSLLGRIGQAAADVRENCDRFISLGIGGSYMGLKAIFEALCSPHHNELTREERADVPRLYFAGHNLDNDTTHALLELLALRCHDADDLEQRWGMTVISKSGGTLETAVAFRVFREAFERLYGEHELAKSLVVPVTGEGSKLAKLAEAKGYRHVFPVPDGIGGRFSVLTPVGLLPAAVIGVDVRQMLQGAADVTECARSSDPAECPVQKYIALAHVAERDHGMDIRVLSTWGNRLESLGFWYDQLLSESLGKQERGATPLTGVNTRDLHSRGQQHQEGQRDKLITNVWIEEPVASPVPLPEVPNAEDADDLNRFAGREMHHFLSAAFAGTNQAYADDKRPTATLSLPQLDAYHVGALFQLLMLATAIEGRLLGINPYGQPGVEAYKTNMNAILSGSSAGGTA